MNEIDLRRFDLNLLVVFDVLMTERSVTRAAERLGRTQSAVSHSLSRLREQFGDPLLLKGGARMQPTALALDTDRAGAADARRNSARAVAAACLRSHDLDARVPAGRAGFHADLVRRSADPTAHRRALVAVEWTAPREPTLLDVAEGLIDIAIVPAELRWPTGCDRRSRRCLGWRCFGRKGHPAFRDWGRASVGALAASRRCGSAIA